MKNVSGNGWPMPSNRRSSFSRQDASLFTGEDCWRWPPDPSNRYFAILRWSGWLEGVTGEGWSVIKLTNSERLDPLQRQLIGCIPQDLSSGVGTGLPRFLRFRV